MKSLTEKLHESLLVESADKKYKSILGMDIVYGATVKDKLHKIGMDMDHDVDCFRVLVDGTVTYTNSKRMVEVTAKLHPSKLNRTVSPTNMESVIKFEDNAEPTFDLQAKPYHLFRAVLNALTVGTYQVTATEVVLNDISYSAGDYEKDKQQ